jgi:N-acetylmuramoyl-L-alanine amidase
MRLLRLAVWLLLAAATLSAQPSIPLRFLQSPARNRDIGTMNRGGAVYLSLNDLAGAFGLRRAEIPDARRFELRSDTYTIRFCADNPFVVVVDPQQNASIVQFPVNVVADGAAYFAPADQLVPLLHSVLAEELTYDRTARTLVVGRPAATSGFDIAGVSFEQKANGFLIRLRCGRKLPDYDSFLKTIGDDTWLYLTIANAKADVRAINAVSPSGIVKKIVVIQSPASVQLTFRLKGLVNSTELIPAENSNDILVAVHTPTPEQLAIRKERPFEQNLDRERNRWKLDVVVIDAGHGGTDPGTIGVTGTKEKDVTLGVAMKLGRLIQKELPDVKVVYTRTTDTFVELYRRGQIANQAGGKLFISIHCNATRRKPSPVDGFEIYLLRPGKTDAAIRIAEQENAVVKLEEGYEQRYQQLTEENFILLTMAQSAYVKYSEKFASILGQEMGKHLEIDYNGVKQAGFYVLVGASMPNVLVETAYLSNRSDEAILKTAKGQQRMAEGIFNGVKRYKREYERSLKEGSDIGTEQ